MHSTPGPSAGSDGTVAKDAASASFLEFCRGGDRAALEAALIACAGTVRQVASRLARRSEVDDLVHDCFVVAIRRAQRFDGRGPLLPWLLGILHNLARSRHRLRWARLRFADVAHGDGEVAEPAFDESSVLERTEWLRLVDRELESLAEPYRTVVRAHLVAGESLAAIAARRGQPQTTVRSQFARGLHELKRRLPAPMLAGLAGMLATREATAAAGGFWTTRRSFGSIAAAMLIVAAWLVWNADAASASPVLPASTAAIAAQAVAPPNAALGAPEQRDAITRTEAPAVHVRLSQSDGKPATGVPIVFDPRFVLGQTTTRSSAQWRVAITDAEGAARFAITAPGRAALRLHELDVLHAFDVADRAMRFAFTVDAPGEWRMKLIDDAGQPINGGRILVSATKGTRTPGFVAATTGVDGTAVFRCPLPQFHMWATAEEHLSSISYVANNQTEPRQSHKIMRLDRSALRRRGAVHGVGGKPLPGACVAAWSEEDLRVPPCYVLTDQHGRFSVGGLGRGAWAAAAFVPGFAAARSPRLTDGDEAHLLLTRGGTVSGRVELAIGTDVSSLRVIAMRADGTTNDPLDQVGGMIGTDGTFRLDHVAPGPCEVGLLRQHSRALAVRSVIVDEGGAARLDFPAASAPQWIVRIEDERHRPLVDHLVRVRNASNLDAQYDDDARTDAQGQARLRVPDAAPKCVSVHVPVRAGHDELPAWVVEPVLASELATVIVPDAARRPCSLRGTLPTDIMKPDLLGALQLDRAGFSRLISASPTGTFTEGALPPGDYTLVLSMSWGSERWNVTIAELTLREGDNEYAGPRVVSFADVELAWQAGGTRGATIVAVRDAAGHRVEDLLIAPGGVYRRRLVAGAYVAHYASAAGAPVEHRFVVDPARGDARIELPRTAGRPCRIEVDVERPSPFSVLRASLRRVDAAVASKLPLRPVPGRAAWALDLDLEPGVYEFSARVGTPPEVRGFFTVPCSDELAVYPFVLR